VARGSGRPAFPPELRGAGCAQCKPVGRVFPRGPGQELACQHALVLAGHSQGRPASRKTARHVSENVVYVRSFAMSVVIEDDIPEDFEPSEEEIQVATQKLFSH
jgi:hypothetical protein